MTRRILCATLAVAVSVAAAGCTSSPGSSGHHRATTVASQPSPFISQTVPGTPVGRQLTWFLRAQGQAPLPQRVIEAHFEAAFLRQVTWAQLNSALTEIPGSGGSLVGVLWETPGSVAAVASFDGVKLMVRISVDRAGLISVLLLGPYQAAPTSWAQLDRELAGLAPDRSFLAARVTPGGHCVPVHQVAASTARPLGSMFKLFVLGALAHQIAAGHISWHQQLTVTDAVKSPGSGSLQDAPDGTRLSVRQTAAKMISISDNTAADMLSQLVGRSAVEAQDRQWSGHAALNVPSLTARESLFLKIYPALASHYLSLPRSRRAAYLASSVDPLPFSQAQAQGLPESPTDIDTIEYFASPDDICRAFAGLQQLAAQPALAPLGSVLSINDGGLELSPARWPTVWFKGGGEPGVLTLGYLATNSKGQTFVVAAMLSNPKTALPPSATPALIAAARGAFGLIG